MAGEQIIQSGLIVGRAAGPTITIVPTTDSVGTISFDDRSGDQTSQIKFDHLSNQYTITVGGVTQILITSTATTIDGDLIVNGTTTTVNATNLDVTDKIILLNNGETSASGVGGGTGTSGIEIHRGTHVDGNVLWLFSESNDWWQPSGVPTTIGNLSTIDTTTAGQSLTITGTGALLLPTGTTAQQPTPTAGMMRYNTNTSKIEAYTGGAWDDIVTQNLSTLTLTSTDAGAGEAPILTIDRNSASPAASDILGSVHFSGRTSTAAIVQYGWIYATISDPTNGSEDGLLTLRTRYNAANNDILRLGAGVRVGAPTSGDIGKDRINVAGDYYHNGTKLGAAYTKAVSLAGDNIYGNLVVGDLSTVELSFTGVTAAGSGYLENEILTVSGGTFTTAAQLKVLTVSAAGGVLTFAVETKGVYTVAPASPASVTGGSGTLATFSLTSAASNANILPDVDYVGATIPKDIGQTNGIDGKTGNFRFRAMHAETFHGVATQAQYADLAERYAADATYKSGTVVIFGGEAEITLTTTKEDTRVAGVVSTDPAFRMNCMIGPDDTHPYIALKGKVPCKVTGTVRKGELLVTSSKPGFAESVENNAKPYTAFARANENFSGEEGVIQVSII